MLWNRAWNISSCTLKSGVNSHHHYQKCWRYVSTDTYKVVPTTNTQMFLTGRMPFLLPNQQCQRTEGKHTRITKILIIQRKRDNGKYKKNLTTTKHIVQHSNNDAATLYRPCNILLVHMQVQAAESCTISLQFLDSSPHYLRPRKRQSSTAHIYYSCLRGKK